MDQDMIQDKVRGSMVGGAVGDALGYPVEFYSVERIFKEYGRDGITDYRCNSKIGKALISDDTQMTMFTAAGVLFGVTRFCMRGIGAPVHDYISYAYLDWLSTQRMSYQEGSALPRYDKGWSWLLDVPELYSCRAPGNTCLTALRAVQRKAAVSNNSKGCGGIMRVAPLGLRDMYYDIKQADTEGAKAAAITHQHPLGYMPAAVQVHIIHQLVYTNMSLEDAVIEARDTVAELYKDDDNLPALIQIIDKAMQLAKNNDTDLNNIKQLGGGWTGEEALAIAVYCSLRHQDDFSTGVIAAVNHSGDSDSTGAIAGNILGAICGYQNMDMKWKKDLELLDVILELSDDLARPCPIDEYDPDTDQAWYQKYVELKRYTPAKMVQG